MFCQVLLKTNIIKICNANLKKHPISGQKKIDEAEARRHQFEENREKLKSEIHGLRSVELKVPLSPNRVSRRQKIT